ncbi:hypothetical protein JXB31_04250 [Candidatus Woesearchaeota archaeon]|nr:hypothetical protein [Candidatus Woesearchaeota archaeon]
MELNFFNVVENLEPKCVNCGIKVDYGVTTRWDDELEMHICLSCGKPVDDKVE